MEKAGYTFDFASTIASALDNLHTNDAYDLMLLRQQLGEVDEEEAKWWTDAQKNPAQARKSSQQPKSGRRRRRKPRRPAGE